MRLSGRNLLFLLSAAFVFSCGGKNDDTGSRRGSADGEVRVDCSTFDKKLAECSDAFIAEYINTETGAPAEGEPLAARTTSLNFAFGMVSSKGESHCRHGMAFRDLSNRSGRWAERFNTCDSGASCDVWAKCTAHAIGNPLKID